MKHLAYRIVSVDDVQTSSALVTARCPHVHPGPHRLFPTVPNRFRCACGRSYDSSQVVELARQANMIDLAFLVAADLLARDPHGFRTAEVLTIIDGAFDALRFTADDFGVRL